MLCFHFIFNCVYKIQKPSHNIYDFTRYTTLWSRKLDSNSEPCCVPVSEVLKITHGDNSQRAKFSVLLEGG